MNKIGDNIMAIMVAIIGLATIAVIVGKNAKTGDVISSAGKAFVDSIKAAVSPVA